ncbi:MAG: 2-oxo acid dehydrogenase subunit E2 [Caldilinea sp.]|nr:2-oxo acid dehydrogenase subunit E2 [Caldilineaceae bacterium]MCB9125839.1 2-oxo acid dehydrogenase subunit E2 [Caldilineaceae bacterium]MCO5209577.1 2-oxo acid dehydrogenase subunit E2 [Caldilinea sp.]MCW5843166.1 2-oxo acid dehydrogenase subunit E2 [Caldilinea sp.]
MTTPVKMPQLGESVVEGTVARWLKAPGDAIAKHEPLLEISTDKIDTEVPAPADGVLLEILVPEGTTVAAGALLATIGVPGESPATAPAHQTPPPSPPPAERLTEVAAPSDASSAERPAGRTFISPVVARMSAEHGIDLAQVEGSGLGGRITKKDVEAFLAGAPAQPTPQATPELAASQAAVDEDDVLQPLTTMRRAIAQHMVQSKHTSPHVTTIMEADMTAVVRHREANKRTLTRDGETLTYTPYFVAAIVAGLRAVPQANSRFGDDGILLLRRIHVGIAVAVDGGLFVPVIRNADELSLAGLARAVNDLARRARAGQLQPDEIQGGTFTLTNHGTGGSLIGTPIINQPQSGILGAGAIVKRPVVRSTGTSLLPSADDAIVIRPMCYLSYTFDHRVLDGAQADKFLAAVKAKLENWDS